MEREKKNVSYRKYEMDLLPCSCILRNESCNILPLKKNGKDIVHTKHVKEICL